MFEVIPIFPTFYQQYLLLQLITKMGQGATKDDKQVYSSLKNIIKSNKMPKVQRNPYEGFLKLSKTPFKNCHELELKGGKLFLEKARISVKDLIRNKIRLGKSFGIEQLCQIIQNISFSLAYLESIKQSYPNLTPSSIFFCDGHFKLLPVEVVEQTVYRQVRDSLKNKTNQYAPISPQMVIALRCQESCIKEPQILMKSNVFALGMLMLEICTLKPSSQCYDLTNYDVLGDVVTSRIAEIEAKYPRKIVMIIANMLDYDYEERMTPKQLSIWVNRQFQEYVDHVQENFQPQKEIIGAASRLIDEHVIKIEGESKTKKIVSKIDNKIREKSSHSRIRYQDNKQSERSKSQTRRAQIKQKIQKQKLFIEIPNQSAKQNPDQNIKAYNRAKSKSSLKAKTKKQTFNPLPNPYLNTQHIQKELQPQRSKSPSIRNPLTENQLHNRYQYRNQNDGYGRAELSSNRDRSMDLKYKYNLKNDCDRGQIEMGNIKYEKRENRSPLRNQCEGFRRKSNEDYCPKGGKKPDTKISNFCYEQDMMSRNEPQNRQLIVQRSVKNFHEEKRSPLMQKINENPYERHQKLPPNEESKSYERAEENMKKIRQEIEKSRKIIQEVKKSEREFNKIIQF